MSENTILDALNSAQLVYLEDGLELRCEELPLWGESLYCLVRCDDDAEPGEDEGEEAGLDDSTDDSTGDSTSDPDLEFDELVTLLGKRDPASIHGKRALVRGFRSLLPGLRKHTLPPMPDLRQKTAASYDQAAFSGINQKLQSSLRRPDLTPEQHCRNVMPILEESRNFLSRLNLPEEVLRDDSPLYYAFAVLNSQAHGLRDAVMRGNPATQHECLEALSAYIAAIERLIDLMDERSARLRGMPRPMTPEEYREVSGLDDEMNDDDTPLERSVKVCLELLTMPLVTAEDKIEYIGDMVERLEEEIEEEIDGSRDDDGEEPERAVLVAQKAAKLISMVEARGREHFAMKAAQEMLTAIAGQGGPAPDAESLAAALRPESVTVSFLFGREPLVQVFLIEEEGYLNGEPVAVSLKGEETQVAPVPPVTVPPVRSLGREYARRLKRASLMRGIDDFKLTSGADPRDLAKLRTVYPDAPQSLLDLLAELDGTYYREYSGQKVTLTVFDGEAIPYYLNSVRQILGDKLYADPVAVDSLVIPPEKIDESGAPDNSIAYYYGVEDLDETVAPGIDPFQPLWRMLHFSDCVNNGGSSQLYIDFHPAPGGVKGQVVRFVHDPDEYDVIAPDFDAFLRDRLKSGFAFLADEDD